MACVRSRNGRNRRSETSPQLNVISPFATLAFIRFGVSNNVGSVLIIRLGSAVVYFVQFDRRRIERPDGSA